MSELAPLLSICIPAYNRPVWLSRALRSVAVDEPSLIVGLEIVITDDSTTDECQAVVEEALGNWEGRWRYVRNPQRLGMTGNWNESIAQARGDYVLVLHDDDFLLPGGVAGVVETLQSFKSQYKVLLFGVQVVNDRAKRLRTQMPKRLEWLAPAIAVLKLLGNSSFIRFPGMVFDRNLVQTLGGFRQDYGGAADVEMWLRLLSQEGLFCVQRMVAAYTVHSNALTMDMFNGQTIGYLNRIFEEADQTKLLTSEQLERVKSDFFHQFILAGTFRHIRRKKYVESARVMQLFERTDLQDLRPTPKWSLLRTGFSLTCSLLATMVKDNYGL